MNDETLTPRAPKTPAPRPTFDADAFTRAMRIAGALLVVASASTFMLQHWQAGNDLGRYAMLVVQSLLLTAAAYFVGLTVREGRSARTFLGLVLATIPVSFAVLGGLVYSQFHYESLLAVPQYASWVAPSKLAAVLALLVTLVVLAPLALVAFLALARRHARSLTLGFVASNLLVIVPVRTPVFVVALAGCALIALLKLDLAKLGRTPELDTFEGKLARAMPFVPPVIMLGRVFHLYRVTPPFVGGLMLVAASALWLIVPRARSSAERDGGAFLAAALGCVGWGLCWSGIVGDHAMSSFGVCSLGLPCAALLYLAALRADSLREMLFGVGTLFALASGVASTLLGLDSLSALSCILLGLLVAVSGAAMRARLRTLAGAIVALFGLGAEVWLAVHADDVLRWVSLSVLGVLLIVGSAYVERHRARVARLWERLSPAMPERSEG
jgi:hypothetical protein